METQTLLKIALITTVSTLLIGIVAMYVSMWYHKNRILNKLNLKWNEGMYFPMLLIGTIIGTGILVSSVAPSISTTLKIATRNPDGSVYGEAFKFISLSAVTIILSVLIINSCSSFLIKSVFDKVDIEKEIQEKKIASAIIYAALFIGLSIALREGIVLLSEVLIPYEKVNF
jgi:hypothetical protein